jgi:hypothetical protein
LCTPGLQDGMFNYLHNSMLLNSEWTSPTFRQSAYSRLHSTRQLWLTCHRRTKSQSRLDRVFTRLRACCFQKTLNILKRGTEVRRHYL